MRRILSPMLLLLTVVPATVAAGQNLLFILDASGSMWGRVDDTPKIVVARDVMTELVGDLPADARAGLIAYGHRRKGDCSDIESLVGLGPLDRDAMIARIQGLNPKGKTPITAAVEQAIAQLRQIEDAASVVLVSDGLESCGGDPCEAVKAARESGVDFRLHVVGFDLGDSDPSQLQCMAEAGGGRFVTAASAEELAGALKTVSAPPEPVALRIVATNGEDGAVIEEGLAWDLRDTGSGETPAENRETAALDATVLPGAYRVTVRRAADGATAERDIRVTGEAEQRFRVALPALLPDATLSAPESAAAGARVAVSWTGPADAGDTITVDAPDEGGRFPINSEKASEGSPVQLLMPPKPGDYEIRYVQKQGYRVLARQPVTVTAVPASVAGPGTAAAGSTVSVQWRGPAYNGDTITVDAPDEGGRFPINSAGVSEGSPVALAMPPEPGTYELRYVQKQGYEVLARQTIEIEKVPVSVRGPETAAAGATIEVAWSGPEYDGDTITVDAPDEGGRFPINGARVSEGSPATLQMPPEPGTYELRYVQKQGYKVLARQTIAVTDVTASVSGPARAPAGAEVDVEWRGPAYGGDTITVDAPGEGGRFPINSERASEGSPVALRMPPEPGDYELRYVMKQDHRIVARQPITVDPVSASLDAPASGVAGGSLTVQWEGPAYSGDYIAVDEADARGRFPMERTRVSAGSPLEIALPDAAGDYELRYVQKQGYRILARQPLSVRPGAP
ncbi:vWA domain-containing protein [Algiphilus sp.]|uniref:vWA domain-containing protein n=1 Tax=Algiphilus sp. TaxID=1872431 RepID=UPI0025B980A1|nr:vWA domain-containing protein [Algiphilus sp.]MCK5769838.1 VWA domain-containing protein [Algiphilus sp.]